jgi:hypothetical protein
MNAYQPLVGARQSVAERSLAAGECLAAGSLVAQIFVTRLRCIIGSVVMTLPHLLPAR